MSDPLDMVTVPDELRPLFRVAASYVRAYFSDQHRDPARGEVRIGDERYLMLRSASLSVEFFDVVKRIYGGAEDEAEALARALLFDVAHAIGIADARDFHARMGVEAPIERLSVGPVHFAFAGWARVRIDPASQPSPDDDFVLVYEHAHTFEAEAWRDRAPTSPVCVMNAGYSSGWCEASFDMPLVAAEVQCEALGDPCCRFVMAPPDRLAEHIDRLARDHPGQRRAEELVTPGFFAERLAQQRALHESEARFRHAFDHAGVGMALVGVDGVYVEVNQAFADLFGYAPGEIAGHRLDLFADAEERARTRSYMRAVLAGELDAARFDARGRTKAGEERFTTLSTTVIRDADGEPLYFLVQVQDRTREHRAQAVLEQHEQRMRQAQKLEALGRLAGGVAHDFNNLLTVILAATDQLEPGDERGRAAVEAIVRASTRAGDLTRQLLAFGRKQMLHPSLLDPVAVVRGLTDLLDRLLGEDIEVRLDCDPAVRPVRVDPTQLEQVLVNLAINARDAMPDGGVLTISLYDLEPSVLGPAEGVGHVALEVADTGHGMTPDVRERIFEPFFTTKGEQGTGLGLALVYGVVQQSGGTVTVDSAVGHGTTFLITFPVADDPLPEPEAAESADAVGGSEVVLLAEDDDDIRELVTEALQSVGYEVRRARDGEEAVALAQRLERVDLLLTDIVMPRLSGPTTARQVLDLHPGARVVFMTGYAADDERRDRLPPDAVVLRKPFRLAELDAVLRAVLHRD